MKRYTLYTFPALALLLAAAACTQDDAGFLPEGAEGTPIVFTATGLHPDVTATAGTRAPVDGNWEGVQSVAVLMDGTVKAYNVTPSTSDHTGATLTSTDPHYWTNHDNITVTAWWPYTEGETTPPAVVVKADQSARKDFEGSDLIVAEEQTVSYGNPTLRFTHRTARVTVVLTDYTEGLESVSLTGLSTENGNPAVIAPYDKGGDTYTALVAPQTVAAGTAFITCAFNNGKTFAYRMQGAAEWKAGEEYTYTVSLAAAKDPGYTVSEDGKTYEVYNAEGLKNIAELVNEEWKLGINITLTADIDLSGIDWTPIGIDWTPIGIDYNHLYTGTFNGGGHTITGLTMTGSDEYAGLFGYIGSGGTVKNVKLEDVQIESDNQYANVGGVAGKTNSATLTACYATGSVTGTGTGTGSIYVGGVTGDNFASTLTACYHAAETVSSPDGTTGGVAGRNYKSTDDSVITACYWGGNGQEQGIGYNQAGTGGGTEKVTDGNWTEAMKVMNEKLSGTGWLYVPGPDGLPVLEKKQ